MSSYGRDIRSEVQQNNTHCFNQIIIDIGTVRQVLPNTPETAAGPDRIPGVFYRKLSYWLAVPLTTIYQQSVHHCHVPKQWKEALVIPLYKGKGPKNCASSFRLISLTVVASKVLERISVNQVRSYLIDNNMICEEQLGFLPQKSTVSNLVACDSAIADKLNCGQPCDVFLLDFARAFDRVQHHILIRKFNTLGITGSVTDWQADFLSDRTQRVVYGMACSHTIPVQLGVVQGSVIDPLAFTVFINDLPRKVKNCRSYLFADEAKLFVDAGDDQQCDSV